MSPQLYEAVNSQRESSWLLITMQQWIIIIIMNMHKKYNLADVDQEGQSGWTFLITHLIWWKYNVIINAATRNDEYLMMNAWPSSGCNYDDIILPKPQLIWWKVFRMMMFHGMFISRSFMLHPLFIYVYKIIWNYICKRLLSVAQIKLAHSIEWEEWNRICK